MRRLIGGFAGRTYHIVVNLMHWLIYLLSLCTHCICAKCRGRTLKVNVKDECCVKYQTAHTDEKRVDIYGKSDYQLDACMPNVVGTY